MMTTLDEVLKRAFDARAKRRDFLLTYSAKSIFEVENLADTSFLASLRADGWTLAPVKATQNVQGTFEMIAAAPMLYEALCEVMRCCTEGDIGDNWLKARVAARAALAAARNEGGE